MMADVRLIDDKFPEKPLVDTFSDKEQTAITVVKTCAIRLFDGALFEASHPGFCDVSSMFSGDVSPYFFREIAAEPRKWWHLSPRFRRTGMIWRPPSRKSDLWDKSDAFDVCREGEEW